MDPITSEHSTSVPNLEQKQNIPSNTANPENFKPKLNLSILIVGVVTFLLVVGSVSAVYFGVFKQKNKAVEPTSVIQTSPTPISDSIANWKTFTSNTKSIILNYPDPQQFSFQYSPDYKLTYNHLTADTMEQVVLEKDTSASGKIRIDFLREGSVQQTDSDLKKLYGNTYLKKIITLNAKEVNQIILEPGKPNGFGSLLSVVRIPDNINVGLIEVSLAARNITGIEQKKYLDEFNQILSTFKFTDQKQTTETTNNKMGTLKGTVKFVGTPCAPQAPSHRVPPCDGLYSGYEVKIYDENVNTLATTTKTDTEGIYFVQLPAGTYVISTPNGISNQLQNHNAVITLNTITNLDLSIDTGIR